MKIGYTCLLLHTVTICVVSFNILNLAVVHASEAQYEEQKVQLQPAITLSDVEKNQPLMKEIALHILQDRRSKKRIETKFKEHSQEEYLKWKQAIEEGTINHLTKKGEFFVFNGEIHPKNISTIITMVASSNHFFRNGKNGQIFVTDKDYGKLIANKYIKNAGNSVSMALDNPQILVVLLNINQISNYILKNGLDDKGWKSLGGLIITMYPTTKEFMDLDLPRIY